MSSSGVRFAFGYLGINEILRLFLAVCNAVQYAHQNLIVHRDLKPGNIPATAGGNPRLLDFGTATMLTGATDDDADRTRPTERLLTPSSACPEQVAGDAVTTAGDVYARGCCSIVCSPVFLLTLKRGISALISASKVNLYCRMRRAA